LRKKKALDFANAFHFVSPKQLGLFFLHHHFAFVIHFVLHPVGAVKNVWLACGSANGYGRYSGFVVSTSFVSTG
jgi:hypothetical protein